MYGYLGIDTRGISIMYERSFLVRNIIMLILIFIRAIINIFITDELRKSLRIGVQLM